MDVAATGSNDIYDVVCVGFGPAGIALATAMDDAQEARPDLPPWKALFLEQNPGPRWQSDMLLGGTDVQHPWLRDFATPRNPRSRFTFICYLHEKGRLYPFQLLGERPGRVEWADYVAWVAGQLGHRVRYGQRVDAVEPVRGEDGDVELLSVRATEVETGETRTFLTRDLVLCTGRRPHVPAMFQPLAGPRVFHSHHFLTRIAAIDRAADPSFAVIGAGQNAIEVLIHLSDHFPRSRITCVQRNNGFRIQDLGHFTNQAYFPEEVDYFHSLPPEGRRRLLDEQKVTNYASVDYDVSRTLYWKMYEEQVRGDEKLRIVRRHEVRGVALEDGRYRLSLADVYLGTPQTVEADVVVLCTGFVEEPAPAAVDALRPHFVLDADGQPEITRGYRVVADGALKPGIFVSGISEKTHGIAEATSFSMMALKAQRVLDGLSALRDARAPASAEVCADTPRRAPIVLAEA